MKRKIVYSLLVATFITACGGPPTPWQKEGFTGSEPVSQSWEAWEKAYVKPEDYSRWKAAGVNTPQEVQAWKRAGARKPVHAYSWIKIGVKSPQEMLASNHGRASGPMTFMMSKAGKRSAVI
jgi:hypothetical protein